MKKIIFNNPLVSFFSTLHRDYMDIPEELIGVSDKKPSIGDIFRPFFH